MQRVLEAAALAYAIKTRLGSSNFLQIANSVLKKGKSAIPPLSNDPKVLSSAFDKEIFFPKNIFKNSNLDNSGISLLVFPSRTNLELCKSQDG